MYRSKHQKGYITSHQVKTTRFRTWKSGKKWLYSATALSLTVTSILPVGNLAFLPKIEKAQAATTSSGTLVAGQTYNTGGGTYSGTEFANANNYTLYGSPKPSVAGNWLNLISNTKPSVGIGIYNGAVSTVSSATAFSLSTTIKVDPGTTGNFQNTGDSLGIILTGVSQSLLQANVQNANSTGAGLGIEGLANTIFIGRDLYSNLSASTSGSVVWNGPDGTVSNGWSDGGGKCHCNTSDRFLGTINPSKLS